MKERKYEWKIRDAFGKQYSIESCFESKEEAEEYIGKFFREHFRKVAEKAVEKYCPGFIGVAEIDLQDGSLTGGTFSLGSGDIETHFILVFRIDDRDFDFDQAEELLDEEEKLQYYETYQDDLSVRKYIEEIAEDDFWERFVDYLEFHKDEIIEDSLMRYGAFPHIDAIETIDKE